MRAAHAWRTGDDYDSGTNGTGWGEGWGEGWDEGWGQGGEYDYGGASQVLLSSSMLSCIFRGASDDFRKS